MSARAIRKLQGDNVLAQLAGDDDDDDDDDDDSSLDNDDAIKVSKNKPKANAFALMSNDDDDDVDSSSSSSEDEEAQEQDAAEQENNNNNNKERNLDLLLEEEEDLDAILHEFKEMDHKKESVDTNGNENNSKKSCDNDDGDACFASLLLQGLDVRDLDMDYTMRNSLLQQDPLDHVQRNNNNKGTGGSSSSRNSRTTTSSFLFGSPRDDWKKNRPPNFIGGGMGMICYHDNDNNNNNNNAASSSINNKSLQPPWPYPQKNEDDVSSSAGNSNRCCWYTFRHADSLQRDVHDYQELIVNQGAGNVNALILFVAHHAYIPTALLQLSTVLYQTNHNVEALSMLKRCLYIYECARLYKFTKHIMQTTTMTGGGGGGGGDNSSNRCALLDYTLPENAPFFEALVQLMRVCTNAGLYKSTLAIQRYILSLDPLRDPMGILLVLDSFALHQVVSTTSSIIIMTTTAHFKQDYNSNNPAVSMLEWFIALCENNKDLQIWYRDPDDTNSSHQCDLLSMPNWAYSYAVALYQMSLLVMDDHDNATNDAADDDVDDSPALSWKDRANKALQQAMRAHPTVVGQLLAACEVDTTGRSFQRDWPTVLVQATDAAQRLRHAHFAPCKSADETIVVTATLQAVDKVIYIYTKVAAKTWCQGGGSGNANNNDNERRNDLFQWLYDNLVETMQEEERISNLKKQPPSSTVTNKIDKDDDTAKDDNAKEQSAAATQLEPPHDSLPRRLCYPAALMRYSKFHVSDFISNVAVLQLPGDVMNAQDNIIDPGMLAHAMVIDSRRPRFRRFMDRRDQGMMGGGGGQEQFDGDALFAELQQQQRLFQQFGGPPRGIVDPDWPAMEVFWRSFLPWNHVDGVPPPPPPPPGAL